MSETAVASGSLVFNAADRLLACLLEAVAAAPDDPAGFTLHRIADNATVGEVRVWRAPGLRAIVEVRVAEPARGIAATMLHAFVTPESTVPHFASDLSLAGARVAVGVDLLPRVDPVAAPDWAEAVYPSLDQSRRLFDATPGATAMEAATARWRALCSPWLIGASVGVDRIDAAEAITLAYLRQWSRLLQTSPPGAVELGRDQAHLQALFHPDTDEVWDVLDALIGSDSGRLRNLLAGG